MPHVLAVFMVVESDYLEPTVQANAPFLFAVFKADDIQPLLYYVARILNTRQLTVRPVMAQGQLANLSVVD